MKTLLKYLFLGGAISAFAGMANAIPTLYITDGTNAVTIADGSALDTQSAPGVVAWSGSLGNWSLNFDTALTYPAIGSASKPMLDLIFGAFTQTGGTLWIEFSQNGFALPGTASASFGGTTDGTTAFAAFGGVSNSLFDVSTSDRLLRLPSAGGTFSGPAFSGTTAGGMIAGGEPYSITEYVVITQTGAGNTTGNATLSVPDGGTTVLLLGAGLMGLTLVSRSRRRNSLSMTSLAA